MADVSPNELLYGSIPDRAVHLCNDMQLMFAAETPWKTPWMDRVAPVVTTIAREHASSTIFTRFIPADYPGAGEGVWRRYWQRWSSMTLQHIDTHLVGLLPELAQLAPPATVFDKRTYSPWVDGKLHALLQLRQCTTLIVTGGETDVCVLASVLGAVDHGYRVIVVTDAICSSSDETHDAVMTVYARRYGQQIEAVTAELVMDEWRA
ncbi:MAG: cysteine hydrolase [Burkholderiales bacterium]|jgi:nicotinamidase-related amidase|nr:MAG: cysteine hydrolase [Burkholderiales bacterium]